MEVARNKGRFAFDLLLSLDDASFMTATLEEFYLLIKNVLCEFMGVENFYVALLNNNQLHYPLAVKNQEVVQWKNRELSNRLTDKVILEGESIFLTKDAENIVVRAGFDSSDESLSAWMGVPLIVQNKAMGCLSVFSYESDFGFDEIDEVLFSLVAAKVSSRLEISELKTSNTEYLERLYSKQQIESVLDSVSGGVIFVDLSGYVAMTNKAFRNLIKIDEAPILYSQLPECAFKLLACDVVEMGDWLAEAGNQNIVNDNKNSYQVKDKFYQRELTSVFNKDEIVGLSFVLNDVSDEVSLRETRNLISSTIVHDLRSPMSAVVSAILLINEVLPEDYSNPVYDQAFEIAQRNVQRVINLVESLLDISKLESGKMQLFLEEFDLRVVIDELLMEQKSRADYMNISFNTDYEEAPVMIHADRNMIQRVVLNLIDNALKFSMSEEEVKISLEHEDGFVLLRVADHGPGIPEDQRSRIFERFAQISGEKKSGSGLGLTFCRLAIEAHGGEVFVEENDGGGSVFVVKLPS